MNIKLVDELLKDYKKPGDLIGETGLLKQLTTALQESKRSVRHAHDHSISHHGDMSMVNDTRRNVCKLKA